MIVSLNFYTYLLIFLLIISFTLNPYFKKSASHKVSTNEFLIIYHFIASFLVLCYIGYLIYTKKCSMKCFNKLNPTDYFWTFLACLTGVLGTLLLIHLIKQEEVSFIMPNVQALVIALSASVGYFIFKESMDKFKFGGIVLIIIGVVSINYSKLKLKNN